MPPSSLRMDQLGVYTFSPLFFFPTTAISVTDADPAARADETIDGLQVTVNPS